MDDTALITLRSFSSSGAAGEQLRRFVKDYPKHFESRNILFDLRDNNGGTLQFVQQWINQARSGEWRSYPRLEIVGALWPCSLWNIIVERQIREGSVDTAEAKRERAQLRAEWGSLPPPLTSRLDTGYRSGRATSPYEGRVFVLVNRNSGSSGELAAVELKRAMKAVILGERSYGAMQYGEARRFVLPNTGLICQLPTKRFYFDDQVESVGWPVDVYLDRIDQEPAELVPYLDALSKVNQY